jgi:hypothetical protein
MPCITDCPRCGKSYEEKSEEEASSPNRLCLSCYREASVPETKRDEGPDEKKYRDSVERVAKEIIDKVHGYVEDWRSAPLRDDQIDDIAEVIDRWYEVRVHAEALESEAAPPPPAAPKLEAALDSRWISIRERQPRDGQQVLIKHAYGDDITTATFFSRDGITRFAPDDENLEAYCAESGLYDSVSTRFVIQPEYWRPLESALTVK